MKFVSEYSLYHVLSDYFCIVEASLETQVRTCDNAVLCAFGKEKEVPNRCENCGKVHAFDDFVFHWIEEDRKIKDYL